MGEWKAITLGEFVRLQRGHDLTAEERTPGNFPVMGSAGQNGTHGKFISRGPGVVIGRSGASIGRVHYVKSDYWPHNTCLYVTDFLGNEPKFASYFLDALGLASYNSGSAQPSLNRNFIYTKPITVPPPKEQRAIAHILGTLDDKIELNRRQSETLQEMARALFKAWFVDFEPVRAKMSGRWQRGQTLPGLPAHLWNLFPDRLVETEHGEVPQGWETVLLGDFIETVKGRSYKSTELAPSTTALVTLKSFARGGGYRADGLKSYTGAYKPEQVVEPSEVVISCTDVTQAAEVIGRAVIVRESKQYQTLVASLDTVIVRPRSERITRMFLYHLGRSERFVAHTCSHVTGTTVLHLAKNAIPSFQFPLPPQNLVHHFDEVAAGMFARVTALEHEVEYIVALRDALLPKLISGELRIGEVNKFFRGEI